MGVELRFAGIFTEQFNLLLNSLVFPILLGRDHSLQFLRIPYLKNVMSCGLSVSIFNCQYFCNSKFCLTLGNNFLFLGRPSFSREVTREGLFPSSSLFDKRIITFSDSVAKRLLAFWYTGTAFQN